MRKLEANLNGIDLSMWNQTGAIEWNNIKVQPGTSPTLPVESGPSRYYAARATDSAPIAVGGQHEKFLFYRGVGSFPVPLAARVSDDGRIAVENRGQEPVPGVMLFENRAGRIGYRLAGAVKDPVTLDAPTLDGSFSQLRQDLEATLVAQGLFPKEAQDAVFTPPEQRTPMQWQMVYRSASRLPSDRELERALKGEAKQRYADLQKELAKFDSLKPADPPVADRQRLGPFLRRLVVCEAEIRPGGCRSQLRGCPRHQNQRNQQSETHLLSP